MGTVRRAAGLVWGVVAGPRLSADDRALLHAGLGGVVLFSRNVESPRQLVALTAEIREAASSPVVIAIDQEGGHIVRIGEPLTRLPSPMAIAATGDVRLARAVARASAAELAACGIDVVLAPVLDVAAARESAVVGARAYGDDASLVARMGAAAVAGYLEGGALPVAKHFPGHGRTPVDSHLRLPVVGGGRRVLESIDLVPYRAAIAAGVPALMTAHVVHRELDPIHAASLSAATARLARHTLGFRGLIVTDAVIMDAVAHAQPVEAAASRALRAGADAVMALEAAWRVIDRLDFDIRHRVIDERRVATAHARTAAFAALARRVRAGAPPRRIGALPHRRAADTVAQRALTLLTGARALPLAASEHVAVIDLASTRPSPVEDPVGSGLAVGRRLADELGGIHVPAVPDDLLDRRVREARREAATVILLTRDAFADRGSATFARGVAGPKTIHVALRNPIDLELAPSGVQIATYHESAAVGNALAAALRRGPAAFPGRLPMALDITLSEPVAAVGGVAS